MSTCCHVERTLNTLVHGDDPVTVGGAKDLMWLITILEDRPGLKGEAIGTGEGEATEDKVPNRIIRVNAQGWGYEADQIHAGQLIKVLNLGKPKT